MILQDPHVSLNPVFTVGDQILEAVKLHRRSDPGPSLWRRVLEALRMVQIPDPERRVA